MFFIRQGATHKVLLGPVVAVGDGFTPVTNLALTTADEAEALVHDSATVVDISGYTWAAVTTADGYYVLTLQSGISGTVGHMTVLINDDSLCLPVKAEFTVLEEAVYDAFYAPAATGVPAAGALEATSQSILTDTAEIGAAGAGLTAINLPNQTMDITGNITGNLSGSVGSVTGAVGSVTAGVTLAASAVQAIWDALTAALTTVGSIGKLLVDNVNATISSRATQTSVDAVDDFLDTEIAAILADTNELQTDWVDGGRLDLILDAAGSAGDPWVTALPGAYGAGTAGKIVGDNLNASVSSRASQTSVDTIDDLLDTEVAAIKSDTAAILVDTSTTLQAELDGIQADTEDIQARLPAALTIDGNIKADTLRIGGTLQTANDVGADVDAILVDTAEIGAAGAGLTAINLPNQTMDIVGNITGNVSGSVGSVTGAVGSVTGAVGSVTGLTAADVGAIKTKTDSLTFTVAGQVDANLQAVNDVALVGDGSVTPWGPA